MTDWYRNNKSVKEPGYDTQLFGADAVRLINAHDTTAPFFLYLAFTAPHTPYQAPQNYLDMYKGIADPLRRAYAAQITAMDDQIGNVLDALEKRHMRDNTLIVFVSDNGGTRSNLFVGEAEVKANCRRAMARTATAKARSTRAVREWSRWQIGPAVLSPASSMT